MMNDEDIVESVYSVTIRNTGDERALGASDIERLLSEFAAKVLPNEKIEVEVESF